MISPLRVSAMKSFLIVATCCLLARGQASAPKSGIPPARTAQAPVNRSPHQAPCWQQVGISKGAIDQRRTIEQSTHAEVESVCADASLTPQQKHAKIKEIRQQARLQIESIITPPQQEELKACNAERNAERTASGGPRPGGPGLGPCGEVPSGARAGGPGANGREGTADPKQR